MTTYLSPKVHIFSRKCNRLAGLLLRYAGVVVMLMFNLFLVGCPAMVVSNFPSARSLPPGQYGVSLGASYAHYNVYDNINYYYGSQLKNVKNNEGSSMPVIQQGDFQRGIFFPGLEYSLGGEPFYLSVAGNLKYQWLGYGDLESLASALDVEYKLSPVSETESLALIASQGVGDFAVHLGARIGFYTLFDNPSYPVSPTDNVPWVSDNYKWDPGTPPGGINIPTGPFFDAMVGSDLLTTDQFRVCFQVIDRFFLHPNIIYTPNGIANSNGVGGFVVFPPDEGGGVTPPTVRIEPSNFNFQNFLTFEINVFW